MSELEQKWRAEFEASCESGALHGDEWHAYLAACERRHAEAEALRAILASENANERAKVKELEAERDLLAAEVERVEGWVTKGTLEYVLDTRPAAVRELLERMKG